MKDGAAVVEGYTVLKDFAGPVATVTAAVAAAYFAWQQSKTAKRQAATAEGLAEVAKRQAETAMDQLRANLFEKRYAVYMDVKQLIRRVLNDLHKPDFTVFILDQHYIVIDEAMFFFSAATCEWLGIVRADCQALIDVDALLREGRCSAREYAELQMRVLAHFKAMPERFRDELSFRQLTGTASSQAR